MTTDTDTPTIETIKEDLQWLLECDLYTEDLMNVDCSQLGIGSIKTVSYDISILPLMEDRPLVRYMVSDDEENRGFGFLCYSEEGITMEVYSLEQIAVALDEAGREIVHRTANNARTL